MKQSKRILSIEFERMDDTNPDTSWMGEYSNNRTSEFSIDRAHDSGCASIEENHSESVERMERILTHLYETRRNIGNDSDNPYYWGIDEACDIVGNIQDDFLQCDCGSGEWHGREYRYFNPSRNYVDANGKPLPGNTPEDVRKYVRQDYDRMESLNDGSWGFIGIRAKAKIQVGDTIQIITSGGLWGIESDSDESYFKEVEQEELSQLRTQLYELGFSKRAIAAAVKEM